MVTLACCNNPYWTNFHLDIYFQVEVSKSELYLKSFKDANFDKHVVAVDK